MDDLSGFQIAGELREAKRLRCLELIASIQSDKTLSKEEKAELTAKIEFPDKAAKG